MKDFLFNFSASYTGGGLKRLVEFSRWFNERQGTNFIINEESSYLKVLFPHNNYFIVSPSRFQRLFNDCFYLKDIVANIPNLRFYYSYGIPIYSYVASKQWFHLSNVAPLMPFEIYLPIFDRVKCFILGKKIKSNSKHYDFVSAESHFACKLFHSFSCLEAKSIVSVNGADDEIKSFMSNSPELGINDSVVCVGTHAYKRVDKIYNIFNDLSLSEQSLRLIIIGDEKNIPSNILSDPRVTATGILTRKEVISYLTNSKYYITCSEVENSYNAASEGIFLAQYSLISNIEPHLELLNNLEFSFKKFNSLDERMIFLKKINLDINNLQTWDQVVTNMLLKAELI
jgi:hypothetical protein|tara:strand:- start:11533 stop:12558 length:1026 start_codon:yes stop_codon:yes gene_type:complete